MFTIGKEYNKGVAIPVCIYNNRDKYDCEEKRYHILYIESGSGSITCAGRKELFMGPVLFCFSENEIPEIHTTPNLKSRSLYLSPEFINDRLSFDRLPDDTEELMITDLRERHWFRVFFERNEHYYGRINLSIYTAKRMTILFDLVSKQLEEQPDSYWPCRSRSYLIEILFLTEQCRSMDVKSSNLFISGYSEEIEKIILYLYNNYDKKITITELVKEFTINRTTMANKFKAEVGDTIINSLVKLRINIASVMLRDTLIPISEIMYRVGFTDLSYFNRCFHKYTNYNPSDYRQKYNYLIN
jgi:AraC family L-rhamnose operon regulatory protein RhaS